MQSYAFFLTFCCLCCEKSRTPPSKKKKKDACYFCSFDVNLRSSIIVSLLFPGGLHGTLMIVYVLIKCSEFQEPVKTKHPQLHYESKLYMLLQGGSKPPFPLFNTSPTFTSIIFVCLRELEKCGHSYIMAVIS